jgi:hypothetical protein
VFFQMLPTWSRGIWKWQSNQTEQSHCTDSWPPHHMTHASCHNRVRRAVCNQNNDCVIVTMLRQAPVIYIIVPMISNFPTLILPRTPHQNRMTPRNLLLGVRLSNLTPLISHFELLLLVSHIREQNVSGQGNHSYLLHQPHILLASNTT